VSSAMSSLRPIFFDLETTGTRPDVDRIIEIAAYDPFLEKTFQQFVQPNIHIPQEASSINGITDDMVRDAPVFAVAGAQFIEFCSGNVLLIAHNGELFDIPFLRAECKRNKMNFPQDWFLVDSLKWARKYRRDLPRHSLQYLREMCKIPPNRAHRALDDVMILFQVFSLMTDDLSPEELFVCGEGISLRTQEAQMASPSDHQMELQIF
jgi:DNA polymerase III subunit epsilon